MTFLDFDIYVTLNYILSHWKVTPDIISFLYVVCLFAASVVVHSLTKWTGEL